MKTSVLFSSSPYEPKAQSGLRFDDEELAIAWPLPVSVVSQRDRSLPTISEFSKG